MLSRGQRLCKRRPGLSGRADVFLRGRQLHHRQGRNAERPRRSGTYRGPFGERLHRSIRFQQKALLRQDIDFTAGTVSVRHTAQRINYGGRTELVVQTPKSAASNRVIPIPAEMLTLLRQYVYAFAPGCYLFSGNPARPLEPRTCQRHFKVLLKHCGLPDRNFHSTRHTYATRCVEEGADIKTVSELLGHSNPQITLRRYMHSSMRHKREVVQRISFLPSGA